MFDFSEFLNDFCSEPNDGTISPLLLEFLGEAGKTSGQKQQTTPRFTEIFFTEPYLSKEKKQVDAQSEGYTQAAGTKAEVSAPRLQFYDVTAAMLVQDTKVGAKRDERAQPAEPESETSYGDDTWCKDLKLLGIPPRGGQYVPSVRALNDGPVEKRNRAWCDKAVDCFLSNIDPNFRGRQ
ncbi:MAG: hypothetical protein K2Z81_02365 [Cyanobacteria bacterium]|nr:hypothetical protein [Cyanobacteriota bacterium]